MFRIAIMLLFSLLSFQAFAQYDVTITVNNSLASPISGASVTLQYYSTKITDATGSVTYTSVPWGNYSCTITMDGYITNVDPNLYVSYTGTYTKTLYTIGDVYQGGYIFHIDPNGINGLVCDTVDLSTNVWGCEGTSITGAYGTAIGTGEMNTKSILADCSETYSAADTCNNRISTIYTDWYLPSKDELDSIYSKLYPGIGDFWSATYWTSSEYDANNAWAKDFSTAANWNSTKSTPHYVRAIRSFGPPTPANAGADQLNIATTSTTLAANTPSYGTGAWSLASESYFGGIFASISDPATTFTGLMGGTYYLIWTITNTDGSSSDTVTVSVGPHLIGDFYQGGRIFYVDPSGDSGLVASGTDLSNSIQWYNGTAVTTYATDSSLFAGKANTDSIIKYQGTGSYAARLCYDLVLYGYSDWYLPSYYELDSLNTQINKVGNTGLNTYWTSNENTSSFALALAFDGPTWLSESKTFQYSVRAIRSFSTAAAVPTATSLPATNILLNGATLRGMVNANEALTTVDFMYGTSALDLSSTIPADQSLISTSTCDTATVALTGLVTGTTYYYCVRAVNSQGTTYGDTLSFTPGTITDIDGNVYNTVLIGTQEWMAQNLRTTKYLDGSSITKVSTNAAWPSIYTNAYCWYDDDSLTNAEPLGALYNWYVVMDSRKVCPTGWHVPTDPEWTILTDYLGGESTAGISLKEAGTTHWTTPNSGADNSSGFTALPAGYRSYLDGSSLDSGYYTHYWSSNKFADTMAWNRSLGYDTVSMLRDSMDVWNGLSIRCIRGEAYQLMFQVMNSQYSPVNNAAVTVSGLGIDSTNESGWLSFYVAPVGSYSYTVTCPGYYPVTGTIEITNENVNKSVSLNTIPKSIYISTTGDDGIGDGSFANPFLTIQTGINNATSGDTIKIMSGVYAATSAGNYNLTISSKSLVIMPNNGAGTVTIDGFDGSGYNNLFNTSCDPCSTKYHLDINGLTMINFSTAVDISATAWDINISGNSFLTGTTGIGINDGNNIMIRKNLIKEMSSNGILYYTGDSVKIIGNTIDSCGNGIELYGSGTVMGVNNIITSSTNYGIYAEVTGNFDFNYNDIWTWGYDSMATVTPGIYDIFVDPLYVGVDDYTLQTGSPCIDAGNPDPMYNDPDGTQADMGAFATYQTFQFTVHVTDGALPLESASVTIGAFGGVLTNSSGDATFTNTTLGEFPITVSLVGYDTYTNYVTVTPNDTADVILTLSTYSLTFKLTTDGTTPVYNATVDVDGYGSLIPDEGFANLSGLLPGTYNYTVNSIDNGHYNSSAIIVSQSDTVNLILPSITAIAGSDQNVLEGDTVFLNGLSSIGSFSSVQWSSLYPITISAPDAISTFLIAPPTASTEQFYVRLRLETPQGNWDNDSLMVTVEPRADSVYISLTGSDVSGDGTYGLPYATIQKGVNMVADSGLVKIFQGTYIGSGNVDVTILDKAVTIMPEATDTVIIDGQALGNGNTFTFFANEIDKQLIVINIQFTNVDTAIYINGNNAKATVFNNKFNNCSRGIYIPVGKQPNIKGNLFTTTGIAVHIGVVDTVHIENNTMVTGSTGIILNGPYAEFVYNNIVNGFTLIGINELGSPGMQNVDYNDVYNCATPYSGISAGVNDINLDPSFTLDGTYHLQYGSPCLDAGNPDIKYNDPDGTRNDIGAFPFDQAQTYTATYYVHEGALPLNFAEVYIDGVGTYYTDVTGYATITGISNGSYIDSVKATNYQPYNGTLVIAGADKTVDVELTHLTYTITFTVYDDSEARLPGAEVILNGSDTLISDINGQVFFEYQPNGTHSYEIRATNWYTQTGSVEVSDSDLNQDFFMVKAIHNISFWVYRDGAIYAEGATVTLGGMVPDTSQTVDASGLVTFTNLADGTYSYTVSLAGYQDSIGNVTLSGSDWMESIILNPTNYSVTFNVDMSGAQDFIPDSDTLYITGNFSSWAMPGSIAGDTLTRIDATYIWTKTMAYSSGLIQYMLFINSGWVNGEYNREITVTKDTTVNITWGDITYQIVATSGANGLITPSGEIGVAVGSTIQFHIIPDLNYTVSDVLVDGISQGAVSNYKFESISANHTIAASFVEGGNNVTFNVDMTDVPDFNPAVDSLYITGSFYTTMDAWSMPGTIGSFKLTRVAESMIWTTTLSLNSELYEYKFFRNASWDYGEWGGSPNRVVTISNDTTINDIWGKVWIDAKTGVNGDITPSGISYVPFFSDQTFSFIPNPHYQVADVIVDGVSVGSVSQYTFYYITSNHTIEASFMEGQETVVFTVLNESSEPIQDASITFDGELFTTDASGQVTITNVTDGQHTYTITKDSFVPITEIIEIWSSYNTIEKTLYQYVPLTGITIDPSTLELIMGNSYTLSASIEPSNASFQEVMWNTSDAAVAIVSQFGVVIPMGVGTATITGTAVDGGYTSSCTVTVTAVSPVSSPDWTRLISFGGEGAQSGGAVHSDANGIYMAASISNSMTLGGSTFTSVGIKDLLIAKYNSTGDPVWIKHYGTQAGGIIVPNVIKTDTNTQNIYVAGNLTGTITIGDSTITATDQDAFVAKFDASGNGIWITKLVAPAGSDNFTELAIDENSNLYLISNFNVLIKFDSNANYQWYQSNPERVLRTIAVKDSYLYIGGRLNDTSAFGSQTLIPNINSNAYIAKADLNGNYTKAVVFDTYAQYSSVGDIIFDNYNNLIIAGGFYKEITLGSFTLTNTNNGVYNYLALCDTSLNFTWAKQSGQLNGPNVNSYKLFTDSYDNIYEISYAANYLQFFESIFIQFTNSNTASLVQFDASGNATSGYPILPVGRNATFVTSEGKMLQTGSNTYYGASNYGNLFLTQYSNSIQSEWSRISEGDNTGTATTNFVKFDASGNMYTHSTIQGNCDFFGNEINSDNPLQVLAKQDIAGNLIWFRQIADGTTGYVKQGYQLALDGSSNVAVAGLFRTNLTAGPVVKNNSDNTNDGYIIKYNTKGSILWSKQLIVNDGSNINIYHVHFDNDGNLLVSGTFTGKFQTGGNYITSYSNDDIFLIKYDINGNYIWSKVGGGNDVEYMAMVETDASNNIYLTGEFHSNPFNLGDYTLNINPGVDGSTVLVKLDAAGNTQWAKTYGEVEGSTFSDGWPVDIRVDDSGNSYLWGWSRIFSKFGSYQMISPFTTTCNYLFYLCKIDTNGDVAWAKGIYEQTQDFNYGDLLDLDASGNIYVGGHLKDTISIDGNIYYNEGIQDLFIAKYDNNGNFSWFTKVPSMYTSSYPFNALAAFSEDVLVAVGENSREMSFGSYTFSPTSTNAFMATLGTMTPVPVSTLTLEPSSLDLLVGGAGSQLIATITPVNASNQAIMWTTSDSTVAIVNSEGFVSPVNAGVATITAVTVDGGQTALCNVTVNSPSVFPTDDWTRLLSYGGYSPQQGNAVYTNTNGLYMAATISGTVTLEGVTYTSIGVRDLLVAKYNLSGDPLFIKQFDAQTDGLMVPLTINSDDAQNIYVAGFFLGSATVGGDNVTAADQNAFVMKLDADGNGLWISSYSVGSSDVISSLSIDGSGNVYTIVNNTHLVKFDNLGELQWVINSPERAITAMAINGSSLIIGGRILGVSVFGSDTLTPNVNRNAYLAKSDLDGNFTKATVFSSYGNGSNIGDIIFNGSQNLVISGGFYRNLGLDPISLTNAVNKNYNFVAQCDTGFNFTWATQSDALSTADFVNYKLFIDEFGVIYQVNYASGNHIQSFSGIGISYNSTNTSSLFRFNGSGEPLSGVAILPGSRNATFVNTDGTIIQTGSSTYSGASDFGNLYLMKFDFGRNVEWSKATSDVQTGYARTNFIKFDSFGNMYVHSTVGGYCNFYGNEIRSDLPVQIISKHDLGGNLIWMQQINDGSGYFQKQGSQLAIDKDNNVFVTGNFSSTLSAGSTTLNNSDGTADGYVIKYNSNGTILWGSRIYADGAGTNVNPYHVVSDNLGNIIVSGTYTGTIKIENSTLTELGSADVFVAKYDANGNFLWAKSFGGTDVEYMGLVSTDADNNIYLTGEFHSNPTELNNMSIPLTTDDGSTLLAKLDADGVTQWAYFYGGVTGASYSDSWPVDIRTDAAGNSYLWGWCPNNSIFGSYTLTNTFTDGTYSYYLTKINNTGTVVWAKGIYEKLYGFNYGDCLDLDKYGNIYVGGHIRDSISIEDSIITRQGLLDMFIAKYDNDGNFKWFTDVPLMYNNANSLNVVAALDNDVVYVGGANAFPITFGSFQFLPTSQNGFIATKGNFIPVHSVTLVVDDGTNPVPGAFVSMGGYYNYTNMSGSVSFESMVNGSYSYFIELTGYENATGTIMMSGENVTDTIHLNPLYTGYPVTFEVFAGADPAEGAEVFMNGYGAQFTDANGHAIYNNVANGKCYYTVTYYGYDVYTDSLTVADAAQTVTVNLTESTYNLFFSVYEGATPIDGAEIMLDGYGSLLTTGGMATFNLPNGTYNYTVSRFAYETASGSVTIDYGPNSVMVDLVRIHVDQTISLLQGWNIFSSYLAPDNADMANIVSTLISSGKLIKVQDQSGNALEFIDPSWMNGIGNLYVEQGYKIKVSSAATFTISGNLIPDTPDIPYNEGWNISGFPNPTPMDAFSAMIDLIDNFTLQKVQSQNGAALDTLPGFGWINNIGDFIPGQGYRVRVKTNVVLNTKGNTQVNWLGEITSVFTPSWIGNGYDHMNIYLRSANIDGTSIKAGDEIGIFDGDVCVGIYIVTGNESLPYRLKATMDDPFTSEIDGFKPGHTLSMKVWNSSLSEFAGKVDLTPVNNYSLTYESSGTTVLDLDAQMSPTDIDDNMISTTTLGDIYPNPFKETTTIKFNLKSNSKVVVEVFDLLGSKVTVVTNSNYPSGLHKVVWDRTSNTGNRVTPGVYIIKMTADGFTSSKRIIAE